MGNILISQKSLEPSSSNFQRIPIKLHPPCFASQLKKARNEEKIVNFKTIYKALSPPPSQTTIHSSADENIQKILKEARIHKWKPYNHCEFNPSDFITDKEYEKILKEIGLQMSDIKEFGFATLYMLTKGLDRIGPQIFQKLWKLEKLSLFFGGHIKPLTDNEVKSLGYDIGRNFPHLDHIQLLFSLYGHISPESFQKLVSSITRSHPNLTSFDFEIRNHFKISSEDLEIIVQTLSKKTISLKKLRLVFRYCPKCDHTIFTMLNAPFNNLTSLDISSINLDFFSSVDPPVTFPSILGPDFGIFFPCLQHLKLSFARWSQIDNDFLITLSQELIQNVPPLQNLSLSFSGCSGLTDRGIKALSHALEFQNQLTCFEFAVIKCIGLTNESLQGIVKETSRNLTNLQNLYLNFEGCPGIQDADLEFIGRSLASWLPHLKSFSLNVSTSLWITDQGVIEFAQHLTKSLIQLESLELNFSLCHELTPKSLNVLTECIKLRVKKLKTLFLWFNRIEKITKEDLKKAQKELQHISEVDLDEY